MAKFYFYFSTVQAAFSLLGGWGGQGGEREGFYLILGVFVLFVVVVVCVCM